MFWLLKDNFKDDDSDGFEGSHQINMEGAFMDEFFQKVLHSMLLFLSSMLKYPSNVLSLITDLWSHNQWKLFILFCFLGSRYSTQNWKNYWRCGKRQKGTQCNSFRCCPWSRYVNVNTILLAVNSIHFFE